MLTLTLFIIIYGRFSIAYNYIGFFLIFLGIYAVS